MLGFPLETQKNRFNGAALVRVRRSAAKRHGRSSPAMLQRGRTRESAEMIREELNRRLLNGASTGPHS